MTHPRCSAATEPETRYDEPAIPHAIKAIRAWQANKATSYTPTDILNDCGDVILAALTANKPQSVVGWEFVSKDGEHGILTKNHEHAREWVRRGHEARPVVYSSQVSHPQQGPQ